MSKRRPRRTFSAADDAQIAAMLADGESFQVIGQHLGRWPQNVARRAYAIGLAEQPPRRPDSHRARMLALYQRGVPVRDILAQYRCSPAVFYHALHVAGVPLRYPGRSAARQGKAQRDDGGLR